MSGEEGADPMKMPCSALSSATVKGWLHKEGGFVHSWKKRWCVIFKHKLYYYKNDTAKTPQGVIDLSEASGVRRTSGGGDGKHFILNTPNRVYKFAADNSKDQEMWIRQLGKALVEATTTEWDDTSDKLEAAMK
mmetsp:Transcript_47086/g.121644  ORF Transcript_47086/g.121644 Transcript_47086/m.121644 type:complete len:134 (+) Transcript_47086:158-559(+)